MENEITLGNLKENRELYDYIRHQLINKFLFANISLQEVLEFINSAEELKIQVLSPERLKYDEFSEIFIKKIKNEITNRIKSGEIEIVKKLLQPYETFLKNTKDYSKAMNIIEDVLIKVNINNDIDLLKKLLIKIPIIQATIVKIIRENLTLIKNNDFSFIKNKIY